MAILTKTGLLLRNPKNSPSRKILYPFRSRHSRPRMHLYGASMNKISDTTPQDAPITPAKRLQIGLGFWKPYLAVVGGAICLLIALLGYAEYSGFETIGQVYKSIISVRQDQASVNLEQMRALNAIANDVRDSYTVFRMVWLQAAQLVLLNLLLPIGTALLGYIFGFEKGISGD